jgi:ribonucleoside-diphosphate reductase alpha chain
VKMMAAAQPFLSGAISKTVNMPSSATVEEVEDVYYQGWKYGLKALAIYRDNCKVGQPLSDARSKEESSSTPQGISAHPIRQRLPKSRAGITTSFSVAGAEGYMTTSAYADGRLGEVFLKMSKQGSTLAGIMDAFSIAVSIGLQYGVPLEQYVQKFTNMRFEPSGMTDDEDIRIAQSVMDYIFRRLALDYLPEEHRSALGIFTAEERKNAVNESYGSPAEIEAVATDFIPTTTLPVVEKTSSAAPARSSMEVLESLTGLKSDAPLCMTCGVKMRMAGSCFVCEGCGNTSGCS